MFLYSYLPIVFHKNILFYLLINNDYLHYIYYQNIKPNVLISIVNKYLDTILIIFIRKKNIVDSLIKWIIIMEKMS